MQLKWESNILKRYQAIGVLLLLFPVFTFAQSKAGITGIKDTSYSTYSAYISTKRNHPHISIAEVPAQPSVKEQKDIAYCRLESRALLLDAFLPVEKTNDKRAAIIIVHGGGWRSGNRMQHHALARRLSSLGYVCFTPEYRLSTEALYPAALHDLKAAVRWVRANADKYSIDTNKIAIAGFSAGGTLAALLGTTNGQKDFERLDCFPQFSSSVNAVINLDGTLSFVHPQSGEGDDSKKTSAATYWFGYSKNEAPELWRQASPLTHVGKKTPPTLFINSSVKRMHAGRDEYVDTLNTNNIYTEVKSFEQAPHSFPLFHPWFEPVVQTIDAFLKKVF